MTIDYYHYCVVSSLVANSNQGMLRQLVFVFICALYILYDIFNILYANGIVKIS